MPVLSSSTISTSSTEPTSRAFSTPVLPEPDAERQQHDRQRDFLPERGLEAERALEALPGVDEREHQPAHAGRASDDPA